MKPKSFAVCCGAAAHKKNIFKAKIFTPGIFPNFCSMYLCFWIYIYWHTPHPHLCTAWYIIHIVSKWCVTQRLCNRFRLFPFSLLLWLLRLLFGMYGRHVGWQDEGRGGGGGVETKRRSKWKESVSTSGARKGAGVRVEGWWCMW